MKTAYSFVAAGLFAASSVASAVPVTLNMVDAGWSGWTGGSNVVLRDSDANSSLDTILWGGNVADKYKSGYRFTDAGNLPSTFNAGDAFILGTFTHFNREIPTGSAISGATLSVATELSILDSTINDGPFTFNFAHNETPNIGCGFALFGHCLWLTDKPVNDIVLLDTVILSNEFEVGGYAFSMEILGFGNLTTQTVQLETKEGKNTTANIIARLNLRELPPPPAFEVPEPATLALLGLGLVGAGLARRKSA